MACHCCPASCRTEKSSVKGLRDPPQKQENLFNQSYDLLLGILKDTGQVEEISSKFNELTTNGERVKYLAGLDDVDRVFRLPDIEAAQKTVQEATKLRNLGNQCFQKGKYERALNFYNDAIAYTPSDESDKTKKNKQMALCLANRSATLMRLQLYEACLRDITKAIQLGYSEELRYKLFDRQGQCLLNLKKIDEAKRSFKNAIKYLEKAKLDNQARQSLAEDFKKEMSQCVADPDKPVIDMEAAKEPPLSGKRNKKYVQLSKSVDVAFKAEKGRHIVAKRNLVPGEVILIEKPYASVVLPHRYGTHCHKCFARCFNIVPCDSCAMARYCSDKCKQAGWASFHHYECKILTIIHGSGIGKFGHLALRTLTKTGAKNLLQLKNELTSNEANMDPESLGCSKDGKYREDDFRAIYHLVTHGKDRTPGDLFKRSSMAAFLLKCLQRTCFFDEVPESDREGLVDFAGGCLLSHLMSYPCNAHEVTELELNSASVSTANPSEIGAGIYSTLSLFNHSCDPAVNRNFYKDTCVVRTIKSVQQGEEITDNYGAVYPVSGKAERHAQLTPQYYFECSCPACVNDWGLYPQLPSHTPQWKCQGCGAPLPRTKDTVIVCEACLKQEDLKQVASVFAASQKAYKQAFDGLMELKVQETLDTCLKHLALMERIMVLPYQEYCNCQETIKHCYSIMGNCFISTKM